MTIHYWMMYCRQPTKIRWWETSHWFCGMAEKGLLCDSALGYCNVRYYDKVVILNEKKIKRNLQCSLLVKRGICLKIQQVTSRILQVDVRWKDFEVMYYHSSGNETSCFWVKLFQPSKGWHLAQTNRNENSNMPAVNQAQTSRPDMLKLNTPSRQLHPCLYILEMCVW